MTLNSRKWPSATSGCTSHGWAATTPIIRFRSSPAPRAATSTTTTASATSTASPASSASTPATAARSWAKRRRGRSKSSTSTRSGATPTRGRSNWRRGSPTLAPGDLNRVFFTNGGSEAVESALKLSRNFHRVHGKGQKHKTIAREVAYHGTSLGALSVTGIPELRSQFEPLAPGGCHVPNTNIYRWPEDRHPLWAADAIEERIIFEGPETVAAVILEPVQNAGGCFVPPDGYFQQVREICDRHDVLMISDEVICAWGRLGHYFGCERFDYVPDIITVAKGLTSAYAPMGGVIASDRIAEPFMQADASFAHGFTFAGHPVAAAIAMANLDVFEREDLCGHVLAKEGEFRQMLESLRELPIVGDVRGAGYFHAIELVKDKESKESFDDEESERLLRGFLSGELYKRGLICRADDRGDPVIQLAPPLIADSEQFEEIHEVLSGVLSEAWDRVH